MFGDYWGFMMKYKSLKNMMFVLTCVGALMFPAMTADAAELSDVVSAGVATAMEQIDDVTIFGLYYTKKRITFYN